MSKFLPRKFRKRLLRKKSLLVNLAAPNCNSLKICVFPNETENSTLSWFKTRPSFYSSRFY